MSVQKTALVTGIAGQDGSYLAELLCARGYRVVGTSHARAGTVEVGSARVDVLQLDLADTAAVAHAVASVSPDEIYNLAARASSAQLFDEPLETAEINGLATVRFLEAIRRHAPQARFCQAASSEIFAGTDTTPQDESTAIVPVNSYGAAKAYGLHMVRMYRSRHGVHASTAILFNHESPRRGEHYVTRKISRAAAMIAAGRATEVELGNLDSRRDWTYAGDAVDAMWRMLQHPVGDDYVVATGKTHSVRDFCKYAFEHVGLDYARHVRVNPAFSGRAESVELRGNPAKLVAQLGWSPSIAFPEMVRMMVDADLKLLEHTG
ncbi:GDP-mannose 4,6-dehydratase [Herbaspirillum chlorophenolicum]|uniref:GDP-mannose 4,6-dehydratase n=1 Tax=Herbaspirillum chlorophenolicum TaxID=211589 RepID=UPI0018CDDE9A|nr:GDP-mannose 4,6-dehydratase [Herbaspirillum chlorophenolicum]